MTTIQCPELTGQLTTGNVADSYNYSEWGVQTVATNTFPQPFGYLGAYTNSTTGLIHLGARYYDPSLGRFTQPDPSTHPGDVNQSSPYTYAGDDPINHTDRTGLNWFDDAATAVSDVAGAVATVAAFIPGGQEVAGVAEGVSLGADAVKTGGDAIGIGDDSVQGDVASDVVSVSTFGVGKAAGAGGAEVVEHGADIAGNANDAFDTAGGYEDDYEDD